MGRTGLGCHGELGAPALTHAGVSPPEKGPGEGVGVWLVLDGAFRQRSWCGSCAQRLGWAVLAARGRALLWAPSSPWVDISTHQVGDGADPSPFGSSWVLWLMVAGVVFAAPGPATPMCAQRGGFMVEMSCAGIASLRPTGSHLPASSALPALLSQEALREGLSRDVGVRVSRANNYFWGKDAAF